MSRSHFLRTILSLLLGGLALLLPPGTSAAPTLRIPAEVGAAPWAALLKKHINDRGLVAYQAWKDSPADLSSLDGYLARFAGPVGKAAEGDAEIAGLINLYNALTIRWILQNFPTESIRNLDDSWGKARWRVDGRTVSLDEIEHKNLRPLYGWRVHATIVCAARSCPPLQREAYTAANLATLTGRAYQAWLGRDDLNHFDPGSKRAAVSAIFKWFKDDFTGSGALNQVLVEYGPKKFDAYFRREVFSVSYLDYHWGLNDLGGRGADYKPSLLKRLF